ncbi:L-type lectin-domain containing receptor kinase IV.1-like [Iris pallida]|uniref:L-type lectin-domain containing receptor kinase IV.1-like n=1 Tax=Iris pallida TaxID=29817 RepID=A0AAX6GXB7_IRIPA|nr:L-type lectin-domain containing receptor kinase IV.1-like [Iris pallida]
MIAAGNGCEHSSPNLSTSSISATEISSRSLGSHVVSTDPFFQFSSTQSTSTICSYFDSMGLLPQATSSRTLRRRTRRSRWSPSRSYPARARCSPLYPRHELSAGNYRARTTERGRNLLAFHSFRCRATHCLL